MVVKVATPEELRFAVPSRVLPLRKLDSPGGSARGRGRNCRGQTDACSRSLAGLGSAVSVVEVGVAVTATPSPDEVDVAKATLPEYTARIVFVPDARLAMVNIATPDELRLAVPNNVLP